MTKFKITFQIRVPRDIDQNILMGWPVGTFYTDADTPAEANRNLEYIIPYPARIYLHTRKTEEVSEGE